MGATPDPVVSLVACASLALVFAASAAGKFRTWRDFPGVVQNYRLLPEVAVRPVAYALPVAEAAVALGIVAGPTRPLAAIAAAVLLVVFSVAVVVNLARGRRHIDCGCFRFAMRQPLSWWLVGRNGLLIAMAVVAAPRTTATRALTWLDGLTVASAAASLFALNLAAIYVLGPPPETEPPAAEPAAS
jgi:uncharacterized membrane protein YphA (DoxX/SURF4 family)